MPDLSPAEAKARFAAERVARMATVTEEGHPHIFVFVFAISGDRIVHAIDHKPKTTTQLRRLRNIRANPQVSILVDRYSDVWEELWWVRADGVGRILEDEADRAEPVRLLSEKYAQYRQMPPPGPVIAVDVTRWSGWSYRAR